MARPRKSIEDHKRDGTFRRDRHAALEAAEAKAQVPLSDGLVLQFELMRILQSAWCTALGMPWRSYAENGAWCDNAPEFRGWFDAVWSDSKDVIVGRENPNPILAELRRLAEAAHALEITADA